MFIIGIILSSTVVAYYLFLIVRECPHCNAQLVQEETVSGNTIGSEFYTEGKDLRSDASGASLVCKMPSVRRAFLG